MPETVGYVDENRASDASRDMVRKAREALEWGKNFRKDKRETKWKQSEQQYSGKHWALADAARDPTADLVTVNVSFSTINTIVPYVTGSDPRFTVEPYSVDATPRAARAQTAWVNRYWRSRESGARRATRLATHDALIYGDGFGKVSYELTEIKRGSDTFEFAEIHTDRINPWDVWIDPMADGLFNARWVAVRFRTTIEELEEDGTYKHLKDLALGFPDYSEQGEDTERRVRTATGEGDTQGRWVELIEFYDLVKDRMIAMADGSELPLKVITDIDLPIVQIENHWLPGQPYHMGDLEQIWSLQQELNKSRSQMLTHRRRNIPKVLVLGDLLESDAEEALTSEIIMQLVKIKGDRSLDEVVKTVAPEPVGPDKYAVSEQITRDMWEVTGVNEYLRGATPVIRRTATEASIIEGASNVKTAHKLTAVEEFTRDLGDLVLRVAADVFPQTDYDEMELYITGKDAKAINEADIGERSLDMMNQGVDPSIIQAEFANRDMYGATSLRLGPDIFKGVYQVEVVQNSTELRNPVFQAQKFREIAQTMTEAFPILSQAGIPVNLQPIYERWLEAEGVQNIDEIFPPGGSQQTPFPAQPPPGGVGTPGPNEGALPAAQPAPPTDLPTSENSGIVPPSETTSY